MALGVSQLGIGVSMLGCPFWGMWGTAPLAGPSASVSLPPLPQQGARVFGALGPIGPSSPGLALGGLAVGEHRLSNKLLAWSGVLEWQEVSVHVRSSCESAGGWGLAPGSLLPLQVGAGLSTRAVSSDPSAPTTEAQALLGLHGEAEAGPPLPGLREPGREPVSGGQGAGGRVAGPLP